ncbi:MAG: hypothetical protein Fur0032_22420 [Terrimicrobiaceae bacterium]
MFPTGWFELSWGGAQTVIEPLVQKDGENASIALIVSPEAEPWCGAGIHVENPEQGLNLDVHKLEAAELVFEVNGGISPEGAREGGQAAQISVGLCDAKGNPLLPPGAESTPFIRLDEVIEKGSIDNDEASWQTVRIPLQRLAGQPLKGEERMTSFAIQFVEKPTSGLYITGIRVESQ